MRKFNDGDHQYVFRQCSNLSHCSLSPAHLGVVFRGGVHGGRLPRLRDVVDVGAAGDQPAHDGRPAGGGADQQRRPARLAGHTGQVRGVGGGQTGSDGAHRVTESHRPHRSEVGGHGARVTWIRYGSWLVSDISRRGLGHVNDVMQI